MKTVVSLAIGFWIARQIYINYDKQEARKKEAAIKSKLKAFLEKKGYSSPEAKAQSGKILGI